MEVGIEKVLIFLACVLCSRNKADEDGRSLVFVFDTTGSMGNDLTQAIAGAQQILAEALSNPERDWRDFILVPFNDPSIGPSTVTTDAAEFQSELSAITVDGGGDCPEMSVGAILEALILSRTHSYLYVFTDASAKDYVITDQVISMVQEKQSKVIFVMTGLCSTRYAVDVEVYDLIASASSGQVFDVDKSNVLDVLDAVVEVTIKGPDYGVEINILSVDLSTPTAVDGDEAVLVVDEASFDLVLSFSGENLELTVTDPKGNELNSSELVTVLDLPNVLIFKLETPASGDWLVTYISSSAHSLRVRGTSTISFDQRFVTRDDVDIDFETSFARPFTDLPAFILIKVEGLAEGVMLTQLELVSVNGTLLKTLPLVPRAFDSQLYISTSTALPDGFFLIQIVGVDGTGAVIKRVSQSAISAVPSAGYNDCELGLDNCHKQANCTGTDGGFICECVAGWTGSGVVCHATTTESTATTPRRSIYDFLLLIALFSALAG